MLRGLLRGLEAGPKQEERVSLRRASNVGLTTAMVATTEQVGPG